MSLLPRKTAFGLLYTTATPVFGRARLSLMLNFSYVQAMNYGRFTLQKYEGKATRHQCPACGEKNEFTLYIDNETGELLSPPYGRCNRQVKCGYHLRPGQEVLTHEKHTPTMQQQKNTDYIPLQIWERTIKGYHINPLFQWVASTFGTQQAIAAFERYKVGTSKKWGGSAIFWIFDEAERCRNGKIMGYNAQTGKRIKEPAPQITWVHSELKLDPFNFSGCLYGLHLIDTDKAKPVCIVESEKTAIVCNIQMPEFIWLATGGIQNLTYQKLYPLRKRKVTLYPDLGAYDVWASKMQEIAIEVEISKCIEMLSGSMPAGFDMCDLCANVAREREKLNEHGYPKEWDL
jgi:hypothetical protein